ncbi:MAG: PQQ-binding-like beta-propeller repeat protein [Pirellulaceae bacterium]|jgi:outer membrane protein assembly factor BamB|nr:PQQ-binding-like beta-propeller repeat protein [Pirellulaceae bacterium]
MIATKLILAPHRRRDRRGIGWPWLMSASLLGATCCGAGVRAGDWPQILGPSRNGVAADETLAATWPADGPPLVWRHAVGSGFAGPAVVGAEVYVFHRTGDVERLERLETATGRPVWRVDFPASYRGGVNPDDGPRCVPLVHADHVYVFGAAGDLHCVARQDGGRMWSRATHREFAAQEGYFGAGSTPLALGNVLLVNVGGAQQAGIVAFALDTGQTVWQLPDEQASYAAPVATTLEGQPHAIFVTRYHALAVAPETGTVRFRFPFGRRGPTVNAATPLVFDGQLFVTSNYGIGCVLTRLTGAQPEEVWSSDEVLSSQYNTAVYHQQHLFGIHGREDVGRAELRCVDARDGTVSWKVPDFGVAHLILAGDRLLLLKVDGTLVLAAADPRRFVSLAEARVSAHTTRALPALAAGRLFLRDSVQETGTLYCLDVSRR